MDRKVCTKCRESKPIAAFGSRKAARDGLKPHCRACEAAYQRAQYTVRAEVIRERKRVYMQHARQDESKRDRWNAARRSNPLYAEQQRVYLQQLRRRRFFVWRARNWNSRHRTTLTAHDLWALWRQQRGRCALSGRKLDATAHLDHIAHVSRNGAHDLTNIRWIDPRVNVARSNMTDAEFVTMCRQVVEHSDSIAASSLSPMN